MDAYVTKPITIQSIQNVLSSLLLINQEHHEYRIISLTSIIAGCTFSWDCSALESIPFQLVKIRLQA